MTDFKFKLNKAFEQVANDALKKVAKDNQRTFERLSVELKGKPLDVAKRRLKQEWEATAARSQIPS